MKDLRTAFLAKYPKYEIILNMYSKANDCPATWENLSKVRLQTFVDYMEERLAPNSVRQYAAKLKAVLNLYNEEVELPKDYNKILSVKNVRSTNVWLTDEELERIITYAPKNTNEQLVRTQFLIGAFTGCRHSDYTRLNNRNIVGGMISYVSLKTKTHATVPLKPIVKELLTNLPKEEVSDPTFNNNIRNICRKAGITEAVKVFKAGKEVEGEKWEFVSSHTARRSFATNLYLRGADLYSISQMMGHASVEMTQFDALAFTRYLGYIESEKFYFVLKEYFAFVSLPNTINSIVVDVKKRLTFNSEENGDIAAPIDTVTTILTPVFGWTSVSNGVSAEKGSTEESDEELRERFRISKAVRANNLAEALYAQLLELEDVSFVRVYENTTDAVDLKGLPPHSFMAIVRGGVDTNIGEVVWNNKPLDSVS